MPQKCYFLSDAHLGSLAYDDNRQREQKLCRFLRKAAEDATDIFLVGDIFDFWYEYRYVVPKGHVRLLGCLAEIADKGVNLHFFIGNHDIWTYGYLADEIGMKVYRDATVTTLNGQVRLQIKIYQLLLFGIMRKWPINVKIIPFISTSCCILIRQSIESWR